MYGDTVKLCEGQRVVERSKSFPSVGRTRQASVVPNVDNTWRRGSEHKDVLIAVRGRGFWIEPISASTLVPISRKINPITSAVVALVDVAGTDVNRIRVGWIDGHITVVTKLAQIDIR